MQEDSSRCEVSVGQIICETAKLAFVNMDEDDDPFIDLSPTIRARKEGLVDFTCEDYKQAGRERHPKWSESLSVPLLRDAVLCEHLRKPCDRRGDRASIAFQTSDRHGNVSLRPGIAERSPHRGCGEVKCLPNFLELFPSHSAIGRHLALPRQ